MGLFDVFKKKTTQKAFTLYGSDIRTIVIRAGSNKVSVQSGMSNDISFSCKDGMNIEELSDKIIVNVSDKKERLMVIMPRSEISQYLTLEVDANESFVLIEDENIELTLQKVKVSTLSGDVEIDARMSEVEVDTSNGRVSVTHVYLSNGGASITTNTGDIDYLANGVKKMNLSVSKEFERVKNEFESNKFLADVKITSNSGRIKVH